MLDKLFFRHKLSRKMKKSQNREAFPKKHCATFYATSIFLMLRVAFINAIEILKAFCLRFVTTNVAQIEFHKNKKKQAMPAFFHII